MASFLTTIGISATIGQILQNAQRQVGLVSPYIRLTDRASKRLRQADQDGKEILVVYGKTDLPAETRDVFSCLENLRLFYLEDLHAKCFFNERELVVSTMNLYAFSEKNNREMGIRVQKDEESRLYSSVLREVRSIAKSAEVQAV